MKEIRNTTPKPLRVPLPQGKTLHLGPRQTGRVAAPALEHPPFQELVESGDVEILGEGEPQGRHPFKQPEEIPSMDVEVRGPTGPDGEPVPAEPSERDDSQEPG